MRDWTELTKENCAALSVDYEVRVDGWLWTFENPLRVTRVFEGDREPSGDDGAA